MPATSEQLLSPPGSFNISTSTRHSGSLPASLPRTFNWLLQEMTSYSTGTFHDSALILKDRPSGRNEPLKKERLKWKSDYPMTDGQLRSKRDEFWDTAPAFEGRKEIWDALKAAAYAAEANDHELAQAILDGASITLPHAPSTYAQEGVVE